MVELQIESLLAGTEVATMVRVAHAVCDICCT